MLKNNLPRIKYGVSVINIYEKRVKEIHWVSLFFYRNATVHFDSVGPEYIPQEILRRITRNILKMQSGDFVICGYYLLYCFHRIWDCVKNLWGYTHLFSFSYYQENEQTIYEHLKD